MKEGLHFRAPSASDVKADIDVMLWSMDLSDIRRYWQQRFFTEETRAADYANRIEGSPRLESVTEHTWHVADTVLLLARHFPYLDVGHCLKLAILHDKLEILTGDLNPLGRDGTGNRAHAFNPASIKEKDEKEKDQLDKYISKLRKDLQNEQRALILEAIDAKTEESRFVKAIDKLQPMAFIYKRKRGAIEDKHLQFLFRFNAKNVRYFPPLGLHYDEMTRRLCEQIASFRDVSVRDLLESVLPRAVESDLFEKAPIALPIASEEFDRLWNISPVKVEYFDNVSSVKRDRLLEAFQNVNNLPPARSGLEAYRQISDALNRIEDIFWGSDYWKPLRSYPPGTETDRMYPVAPECFFPVEGYPGLTALVSRKELLLISRFGAIELQARSKNTPKLRVGLLECRPNHIVLFQKADAYGRNVWDDVNRS